MHAFGLSQELCTEFLRKQSVIANLRPGLPIPNNHFDDLRFNFFLLVTTSRTGENASRQR